MVFMTPEYDNGHFVVIENEHGESYATPFEYAELGEGDTIVEHYRGKWFHRLSASGYMDCTDWSGPFDTLDEARDDCRDTFEIDPDTGDELDDECKD